MKKIDSTVTNGHTVPIESLSPENSTSDDINVNIGIHGDSNIQQRVGEEYQAVIPVLTSVSEFRSQSTESVQQVTGMAIPLEWISDEEEKSEEKPDSVLESCCKRLVPGRANSSWSELEESGFLLGMYLFGKNLVLVKKLIGSQEMGDVLWYYYGRFFKTSQYRRWSECRKLKNRKAVFGQKILSGSRHKKLLARLRVSASEEQRSSLKEMSKAFREGKLVIEEYVFALAAELGLRALIDAMGIGKGKRDLTAETHKPHHQREIPTSRKSLVSLSPAEIISVLTADCRVSKTTLEDLFWGSVWPRLLARGWSSQLSTSSSLKLAYVIPGITEFSRTELSKGENYFESVTDILGLVASKPEMLEIDESKRVAMEGTGGDIENDMTRKTTTTKGRCYLKPPTLPGLKFTVVDTCGHGGDRRSKKFRELRCLPSKEPNDDNDNDDGDSNAAQSRGVTTALLALPAYTAVSRGKKPKPVQKVVPAAVPNLVKNEAVVIESREKTSLSSSSTGSSSVIFIDEVNVMEPTAVKPTVVKPTEPPPERAPDAAPPTTRRQGTRNRSLTTKVLEAYECGFMDVKQPKKRKRKSDNTIPEEGQTPKDSSRRGRLKAPESSEPTPTSTVDLTSQNGNGDVFNELG